MTQHTTMADAPDPGTTPAGGATIEAPPRGSRSPGLVARSVAEAAGSFLVILVGLGATMLATEETLQPSLVFGFAVIAAMIAFGHVSGGHFNPAITLGSAVTGRTPWVSVLPYIVAQLLGAVAAAGLIWLVLSTNPQLTTISAFFGSASNGFDEHSPAGFPLTSAFLIEVVAAALLVAVFLGAGVRRTGRSVAPFAVGLTYAGLISFLLPVTNGAINPIRSAASAVFADGWALEQLWLFWAAPLLGGIIAGLVYRSVDWSSEARYTEAEPVATLPETAGTVPSAVGELPGENTTATDARPGTTRTPDTTVEDRRSSETAAFFEGPADVGQGTTEPTDDEDPGTPPQR